MSANAAGKTALSPQLFPIPQPGRHLVGEHESELMREHTHLPAMVGFVRNHVAYHLDTNRPGLRPAVSSKFNDTTSGTTERVSQHLLAAHRALCQSRTSLPRRAVHSVELRRNLQVLSRKPDPLGAHIVHVRKDRCNRADLAAWLGSPGGRGKALDKHLVQALIRGKHLYCGSAELALHLILMVV